MKKYLGLFSVIVISTLFLLIFYNKVIYSPNSYMFDKDGDGMVNLYNFTNHINNDQSYLSFDGMNYPYSDNIFFIDCIPVLSNTYKAASNFFPILKDYPIGFLNLLMIFSILISAVTIYLIFIEIKTPIIPSIIGSLGIAVLASPTLLWVYGHYALSLSFCFPLCLLFTIKFFNSPKKLKWSIIICLNTIFWFFSHGYLGLLCFLFSLSTIFLYTVINFKSSFYKLETYKYFATQVIIPISIYLVIIWITDSHPLRNNSPGGFFLNTASIESVFAPNSNPSKSVYELAFNLDNQKDQPWSRIGNYIGTTSNLAILAFILLSLILLITKKIKSIINYIPKNFIYFILSGIILLLFSMAYPFKLNLEFILEYISKLRQFRSLGRFAWAFYFIITISSVFFLSKLLWKSPLKKTILLIIIGLLTFEGIAHHKNLSRRITMNYNVFNNEYIPLTYKNGLNSKIDTEKYQAILPLPFFYIGSAQHGRYNYESIREACMIFTHYYKLPMVGGMLSRTAIEEAQNSMQLLAPNFYQKKIEKSFPNKKPFLIIHRKSKLNQYENEILYKSTVLYSNNLYELRKIPFDSLFYFNYANFFNDFENKKNSLHYKDGFFKEDSLSFFLHVNFDNHESSYTYKGNGAYIANRKDTNIVYNFDANNIIPEKNYTLSFWYKIDGIEQTNIVFNVIDNNSLNKKPINSIPGEPMETEIIDGDWALTEINFKLKSKANELMLVSNGTGYEDSKIFVDEILIKETDDNIYKIISQTDSVTDALFMNNHYITRKK